MFRKGLFALSFSLYFFSFFGLVGQEILVPSLIKVEDNGRHKSLKSASQTLSLPFFDDFSYRTPYPDPRLWLDRKVYINTQYGLNPVSIGVATFDMTDSEGNLYPQVENSTPFGADTLTSQPIDLSKLALSDSIYLSFFYQAGGYGDFPEAGDSLKVEFYSSRSGRWVKVWSVPGLKGDTSAPPFKIAMIPLISTMWLDSAFQFRFVNIASAVSTGSSAGTRSNGDIWNIDYVLLNKNRNFADTTFNDIAIVEPLGSFLKNYRSIPWKHYQNKFYQAVRDKINLPVYNLSGNSSSVEDKITIYDVYEKVAVDEPILSAIDISAHSYTTFEEDCPILKSDHADSALFRITAALTTNRYDRKVNDTAISYQYFRNFYAYDDGSAEFGYGLRGNNIAGGFVACRFPAYQQDTLIAVDIYFNRSYNDGNIAYFNLWIWDDNNGLPRDSIGGKTECKVVPGTFARYYLEQPVLTPLTFYVGWQQVDETFLNVGYDRNSPNNQNILYNIDGSWTPSSLRQKGAIMIRPVFGKRTDVGIKTKRQQSIITCFPNPATDWITVIFPENISSKQGNLTFYSLSGKACISRKVYSGERVSIGELREGLYLVELKLFGGEVFYTKLIKTQ